MEGLSAIVSDAAKIAPPRPPEMRLIRDFIEFGKTAQTISNDITTLIPRIADEIESVALSARSLFDNLNTNIETAAADSIPHFQRWSPGLVQPRLLARAMYTSISAKKRIDEFIRNKQGLSDRDYILRNLLAETFWQEVKSVRRSELAPSAIDVLKDILDIENIKEAPEKYLIDGGVGFVDFRLDRAGDIFHNVAPAYDRGDEVKKLLGPPVIDSDELRSISRDALRGLLGMARSLKASDIIEHRRKGSRKRIDNLISNAKNIWGRRTLITVPENWIETPASITGLESGLFVDILNGELNDLETAPVLPTSHSDEHETHTPAPLRERLAELDKFVRNNPGRSVSNYILEIFPELLTPVVDEKIKLPSHAPQKWGQDRLVLNNEPESAYQFIQRVYGPWLGKGLTRAYVRQLDDPLMQAFYALQREQPVPADLDLPTKKEWVDREIAARAETGGGWASSEAAKEDRRLREAARRRGKERE